MESRSIKIKDYVTHERVPVRGDSHGNFTLSPLGFPFVNRSGYERGVTPPPRTFSAEMLVKPDLAIVKNGDIIVVDENQVPIYMDYKDKFDFPRTDSDHDTFIVPAKITSDGTGYSIYSEHADFYAGCYVTVETKETGYEQLNSDFVLTGDNYVQTTTISLPEEGVSCTVTFRPEMMEPSAEHPLFIKFSGSDDNNGIYKLVVDTDDDGILHYTWMYKTSVQDSCESQELPVEFDKTMNDNVHDHYRNRVSDEEVADYIGHILGAAIECGKFRGAEFPADAHGLLVKWFLSRGAIVHSVAGKTVVLDGFGHVIDTIRLGDCEGTPTTDYEEGLSNIGPLHSWLMSTAGENDYKDYPTEEIQTGTNNNIALNVEKSGERHTFVIQQDLYEMDTTPPRKTFIHLPTGLDLADGTEVELNVALPVVRQPTVGMTTEQVKTALKSFTDYVSQPSVYILTGKQKTLPNNSVRNDSISTSGDSFTLRPRHPIDTDASTIAFGLYNRYECQNKFRFTGTVNTTTLTDGRFEDKDDHTKVTFDANSIPVLDGDYILLIYDVKTPIIGKVTEVTSNTEIAVDFGRELLKSYDESDYELKYEVGEELIDCNIERREGVNPIYDIELPTALESVAEGDMVEFFVYEEHKEEKRVASIKDNGDECVVTFTSPVMVELDEADHVIHGIITSISVTDKAFPYNRSTRRWRMYSYDATCIVDVRTVDAQDGLTEHTVDSGAFDSSKTFYPESTTFTDPALIDEDSIVATIYPTSTNTFPWRLNGRNRVRHLGLTTNANVDYVEGGDKPLTRLVFEMNKKVYDGISGLFRGYKPMSELRYADDLDDSAEGHSVIGTLLRVTLPATLDADVDEEHKDEMYVVSRATKAFHDLIGDFKVARVGYVSTRDYNNKKNTSWGSSEYRPDPCPLPDVSGPLEDGTEQRLNDWETKIIHLPNYCLGVNEKLERNLAYAGWNEYTYTKNFRIFYDEALDRFIESDGYGEGDNKVGNLNYKDSKDASGTTQKTEENYSYNDDSVPFNYTAENSVFKLFIKNADEKTLNQYGAFVHGFLDLPIIKRGLRSISWLTKDGFEHAEESEFVNRDMEPFYPLSHVMSTDGIVFPDVNRGALRELAQSTDEDVKRALLVMPDKVALYNDRTTKELLAELISVNVPNIFNDPAIDYMKSLLTMYSNGMPLHMYDAHRAINVDTPSGDYGDLLKAHEIDLYDRNGSLYIHKQHRYCDLAYNSTSGQTSEDVNMTYNLISDSNSDPQTAPLSLTTPLENVSSSFIADVFGPKTGDDDIVHTGMYTRVHVKAMFSSSLGRWVVKDYRQYPTCYLTPLYGAKTIDYTEKSYSYGNPKLYANRVPMSAGVENKKFSVNKYIAACPEQPLWQMPCGVGSDYTDAMNKRYVDVPPMEMNPGCVPFLLTSFPYDDEGKVNNSLKFRNLYESISTPMDADGRAKEGAVPEVNFWNINLHIRPARSAYPGADVPSNVARTGGTIGEPTLGMFNDPITI